MKLLFILLSLLALIFGIALLLFSLAIQDWYKENWKKFINKNPTPKLIENTIIVGSICAIFGLLILILVLEFYPKNIKKSKRKPEKKSRRPNEIFLKRKINQGTRGGRFYSSKKCIKNAKGKVTCKMKKNYVK